MVLKHKYTDNVTDIGLYSVEYIFSSGFSVEFEGNNKCAKSCYVTMKRADVVAFTFPT